MSAYAAVREGHDKNARRVRRRPDGRAGSDRAPVIEYAIRRLAYGVLVIFLIAVFVFITLRLIPGDVVRLQLADAPGVTEEQIEQRAAELGLDKPMFTQLFVFLGGALVGDFGRSFQTDESVMGMIAERLPITLQLGIMSMFFGVLLGVPLAMLAATKANTWIDQLLRIGAVTGISIPSFWLALLLVTYLSIYAGWTPPLTYRSPFEDLGSNLAQMILPALAGAAGVIAGVTRLLRSSLLEVLNTNFIRTVKAKGAGQRLVLYKHAARNSMIPVFTILGLQVGSILGGSVILESIFSLPGMGLLMFEAVQQRDYPVVLGAVVTFGTVFVLVTIVVDLLYGVIDPRVRYR